MPKGSPIFSRIAGAQGNEQQGGQSQSGGGQSTAQQPAPAPQPDPQPTHTHTWVHHDEMTHAVHHDAVTEQKYVVDSPAVWQDTNHCECGATFATEQEESEAELEEETVPEPCTFTVELRDVGDGTGYGNRCV